MLQSDRLDVSAASVIERVPALALLFVLILAMDVISMSRLP